VVQAEDRTRLTHLSRMLASNQAACLADPGCKYLRFDDYFRDIEPHWRKVYIVMHVLTLTSANNASAPHCRAVAWLDSDAVLAARPSTLTALLRPGPITRDNRYHWPDAVHHPDGVQPHMAISGENDQFRFALSPFNAGVWVVANTDMGRAIIEAWRRQWTTRIRLHWSSSASSARSSHTHDESSHTQHNETWEENNSSSLATQWDCRQRDQERRALVPCEFSREFYEQGAFVEHVLPDPRFRHAIRIVSWHVLQAAHPRTLVHHFLGSIERKRKLVAEAGAYLEGHGTLW